MSSYLNPIFYVLPFWFVVCRFILVLLVHLQRLVQLFT